MIKVNASQLIKAQEEIKELKVKNKMFWEVYKKANELLAVVGAEGTINADDKVCDNLMGALFNLDQGTWDPDSVF